MTGTGSSHGAGTVVNAMATGHGAAFGLDLRVEARAETADEPEVHTGGRRLSPTQARLALECVRLVQEAAEPEPLRIDVDSQIPPMKGLKSSSAVAVAVLTAVADHHGIRTEPTRILAWAAEAGLASETSRTGAYDDAAACLLGGLVLTDNARRRILTRRRLPDGLVAFVHVPDGTRSSGSYRSADLSAIEPAVEAAFALAQDDRVPEAMDANTRAYAPVFGADVAFVDRARARGAWAAGLSGTGPAQIALVPEDEADSWTDMAADRVGLYRGDGPWF